MIDWSWSILPTSHIFERGDPHLGGPGCGDRDPGGGHRNGRQDDRRPSSAGEGVARGWPGLCDSETPGGRLAPRAPRMSHDPARSARCVTRAGDHPPVYRWHSHWHERDAMAAGSPGSQPSFSPFASPLSLSVHGALSLAPWLKQFTHRPSVPQRPQASRCSLMRFGIHPDSVERSRAALWLMGVMGGMNRRVCVLKWRMAALCGYHHSTLRMSRSFSSRC
jgi:hypothetical protein